MATSNTLVGDGDYVRTEVGDGLEVGITEFKSGDDPKQSLVYIQLENGNAIVGLEPLKAMWLANRLMSLGFELHGDI